MNKNLSLLAMLLLIASFGLFVIVGTSISSLVNNMGDKVEFTNSSSNVTFTIDDETSFYLMADINYMGTYFLGMGPAGNYNQFDFSTNGDYVGDSVYFSITDGTTYYYFDSMGFTSITENSYEAIARIKLPAGTYTLDNSSQSTFEFPLDFKLSNTKIVPDILKIVLVSILAIASMVGFVIIRLTSKKKNVGNHDYNYYDQQMNKQDHNQELFDADDPFSKYD